MKNLFRPKEFLFFVIITLILYAGAYVPILWNYANPLSGRTYLGFQTSAIDALGNLTMVQRGYGGEWLKRSFTTSTIVSKPFLIKTEFFIVGQIARLLSVNPILMYKISLFISSILYILIVWLIISGTFTDSSLRISAYFLILLSTGVLIPGIRTAWDKAGGEAMVFQRMTLQQLHYQLGAILTVLSIYFFSKTLQTKRKLYLFLSCFIALLTAQIFSPAAMVNVLAILIYQIIKKIKDKRLIFTRSELLFSGIFIFFSGIPMVQFLYASRFYDFNLMRATEMLFDPKYIFLDYPTLIGPIFVSIVFLPYLIKKTDNYILLCISWVFAHPIMMFLISPKLSINPQRFIQMPYYFFWGIITVISLQIISKKIREKYGNKPAITIIVLFLITTVIFSIPMYIKSYGYMTERKSTDYFDLGYPYSGDVAAYKQMTTLIPARSIVLSDQYAGLLMQAFAPVDAYGSFWMEQLLLSGSYEIMLPARRFYSGLMDKDEAEQFIRNNNINYVFFGNMERAHSLYNGNGTQLNYDFLEKIYDNGQASIYKVKK